MQLDPLNDNISSIELIDFMGGELSVVNDARVSYDNRSSELEKKDIRLLKYLIKHRHNSPLRSTVFKFRVKAPLSTTRQIYKHHVASNFIDSQDSWNEKSFRYSTVADPQFYIPQEWRSQSSTNHQQSGSPLDKEASEFCLQLYKSQCEQAFSGYKWLLAKGLAREQARDTLPVCTYSEFIWTISLEALLNFLDLRLGDGAQFEVKQYAKAIAIMIDEKIPHILTAWNNLEHH